MMNRFLLILAASLFLVIQLGPTVITSARLNHQMVALVSTALAARSEGNLVTYTPALQDIADRLAAHYDQSPSRVGSALITLALWANEPAEAYHWLKIYPQAWDRVTLPESNWRTLSLLSFNNIDQWNAQRRTAAYAGWLAGFRSLDAGDYKAALRWFRRGLVLAPGRVPGSVRLAYYRALGNWYAAQPPSAENLLLTQKFNCLADDRPDCLNLYANAWLEGAVPAWSLPESGDGAYFSDDGWRLVGFDLDEDVLAAGVEVRGLLYWERIVGGQVERPVQPFAAPNLVPNPGFEFKDLFVDACVDGYIGSHAYVLPCLSHAVPDPYSRRPGCVAVTETRDKGYALFSSSFPVHGGRAYISGGWFCADRGAVAGIGRQWLTETLPPEERADGIQWFVFEGSDPKRPLCWAQHARVVWAPSGAEEFLLYLIRLGGKGDPFGRAMFDDLFFFELPSTLDAEAPASDAN